MGGTGYWRWPAWWPTGWERRWPRSASSTGARPHRPRTPAPGSGGTARAGGRPRGIAGSWTGFAAAEHRHEVRRDHPVRSRSWPRPAAGCRLCGLPPPPGQVPPCPAVRAAEVPATGPNATLRGRPAAGSEVRCPDPSKAGGPERKGKSEFGPRGSGERQPGGLRRTGGCDHGWRGRAPDELAIRPLGGGGNGAARRPRAPTPARGARWRGQGEWCASSCPTPTLLTPAGESSTYGGFEPSAVFSAIVDSTPTISISTSSPSRAT